MQTSNQKEYLIILIWVRPVTGTIAAHKVVIVLISGVFFIFGLWKQWILSRQAETENQ